MGSRYAQFALGDIYEHGGEYSIPVDLKEALKWQTCAAAQKSVCSHFYCGVLYAKGAPGYTNWGAAIKCMQIVASICVDLPTDTTEYQMMDPAIRNIDSWLEKMPQLPEGTEVIVILNPNRNPNGSPNTVDGGFGNGDKAGKIVKAGTQVGVDIVELYEDIDVNAKYSFPRRCLKIGSGIHICGSKVLNTFGEALLQHAAAAKGGGGVLHTFGEALLHFQHAAEKGDGDARANLVAMQANYLIPFPTVGTLVTVVCLTSAAGAKHNGKTGKVVDGSNNSFGNKKPDKKPLGPGRVAVLLTGDNGITPMAPMAFKVMNLRVEPGAAPRVSETASAPRFSFGATAPAAAEEEKADAAPTLPFTAPPLAAEKRGVAAEKKEKAPAFSFGAAASAAPVEKKSSVGPALTFGAAAPAATFSFGGDGNTFAATGAAATPTPATEAAAPVPAARAVHALSFGAVNAAPTAGVDGLKTCAYCKKPGARKKCNACKHRTYCNKECQSNDWEKEHRRQCKKLQQVFVPPAGRRTCGGASSAPSPDTVVGGDFGRF